MKFSSSTIAAIVATGVLASPAPKAVADGNSLLVPPYNLGARSVDNHDRDSLKDKDTVEFCGLENGKRKCHVEVKADKKCYNLDDWWKGGKFKTSSFQSATDKEILCEMYRGNDCSDKASSIFNFADLEAKSSDDGKKGDSEKNDDNKDDDRDDRQMKMKSRKRDGDKKDDDEKNEDKKDEDKKDEDKKDEDKKNEEKKDEGKKDEDKKDGDGKDGEKSSFDDSIRSLKCDRQ
ncbi:hypothetical protein HYFRA_00006324 [Hymenoscyphus fraxineus]|uniref:Uncharacterized protein n=1 Tax=Hymenoscyphus fraxineus TaxID=746836 RepID=A0A9N9L7P5_9HELO|nr:hypothetical protein HYFRA_00006324 [Hymenoscyphus fraxineus]